MRGWGAFVCLICLTCGLGLALFDSPWGAWVGASAYAIGWLAYTWGYGAGYRQGRDRGAADVSRATALFIEQQAEDTIQQRATAVVRETARFN